MPYSRASSSSRSMPPTRDKPKQFAFILTEAEHRMLHSLASADDRSAANWLRKIIRREYTQLKARR
jgi:hypothetical protein